MGQKAHLSNLNPAVYQRFKNDFSPSLFIHLFSWKIVTLYFGPSWAHTTWGCFNISMTKIEVENFVSCIHVKIDDPRYELNPYIP